MFTKLPKSPHALTLDEISLVPAAFSEVRSRLDVNPTVNIFGREVLPIISSNMDSVYSPELAKAVITNNAISIVHRFCTIEQNIRLFLDGTIDNITPWVSIGSSEAEFERAKALNAVGAEVFVIDLAVGNSINALQQYVRLRQLVGSKRIIVSDFSTLEQLKTFSVKAKELSGYCPDGFTIGQGSGSACRTRVTTGIGIPTATMIEQCSSFTKFNGIKLFLNGGIKDTQDICKAVALGCDAVIIGRLFAACQESGAVTWVYSDGRMEKTYKGSASESSYKTQGKTASWRAPEGEEFKIPCTGTVKELLSRFEGGYLNAFNIEQYKTNAEFILISNLGAREANAYGKWEK